MRFAARTTLNVHYPLLRHGYCVLRVRSRYLTPQSINSSPFMDIAPVIDTTNRSEFAELPVEFSTGGSMNGASEVFFAEQAERCKWLFEAWTLLHRNVATTFVLSGLSKSDASARDSRARCRPAKTPSLTDVSGFKNENTQLQDESARLQERKDLDWPEMIHTSRFSISNRSGFVLCIVATTLYVGGTAWAQIFLTAIILRSRPDVREERLFLMACSLIWLVICCWMVFRQLFFPYTMHLATCAALFASDFGFWRAYINGIIVVTMFIAIRFLQDATNRVLSIEFIVAAIILALAICFYQLTPRNAVSRAVVVIVGSLCAVAGLAI